MAILKPDEIRDMNMEEMVAEVSELRSELARERAVAAAGGSLDNPGRVQELKRTIARILTIMKEEIENKEVDKS